MVILKLLFLLLMGFESHFACICLKLYFFFDVSSNDE